MASNSVYGFRNSHRMAWDKGNAYRMIATDTGEANIEEIKSLRMAETMNGPRLLLF